MISQLRGTISHKDLRYLIVDTAGVGYKVFCPSATIDKLALGDEATLWTHTAVRENAIDLYGFLSKEDLDLFELLITVSGIGPKTAIGVLTVVLPETVRMAISSGDSAYLTKVSGVGKKIAEKIVLELKGKYEDMSGGNLYLQKDADAIEALKALGYSHNEAREALQKVPKDIEQAGEKVKQALKILGSR
jgi:Holliday junction DNA helicase RuvA